MYRSRFAPPKTFLQHIDFPTLERQKLRAQIFSHQAQGLVQEKLSVPSSTKKQLFKSAESNTVPILSQNTCSAGPHRHTPPNENSSTPTAMASTPAPSLGNPHKSPLLRSSKEGNEPATQSLAMDSKDSVEQLSKDSSILAKPLVGGSVAGDERYTWEYALMLPIYPDEVRNEVDLLLSDLIVRLKQLLFNSLLCAYYVGFIPVLFADVSLCMGVYMNCR